MTRGLDPRVREDDEYIHEDDEINGTNESNEINENNESNDFAFLTNQFFSCN